MPQIFTRGDSVYECDECNRRTRIPTNLYGIDVVQRCIITSNCSGKLHRVKLTKDINKTPAIVPSVAGVTNWAQRKVLFNYEQSVRAVTWTINHNLGSVPTLQVFVNRDTSNGVIPTETTSYKVTIVDSNTLTITFDEGYSGLVQCIAAASKNTTNIQQPTSSTATNFQVSNNNILTFAVYNNPNTINFTICAKDPILSTTTEYMKTVYAATVNVTSPWAGTEYIMVMGRKFDVRTVDIYNSAILNGSQISFKIDGQYVNDYKTYYRDWETLP